MNLIIAFPPLDACGCVANCFGLLWSSACIANTYVNWRSLLVKTAMQKGRDGSDLHLLYVQKGLSIFINRFTI